MRLAWIIVGPAVFIAYVVEMFYGVFAFKPIGAFSRSARIVWLSWTALSGLMVWLGIL